MKLAKDLGVKIVLSVAHEYHSTDVSMPQAAEIRKLGKQLIELKRKDYPIMNSISYFKIMAKEKNWQCKPLAMVNIDPNGNGVLLCFVHNDYASSVSIFEVGIKSAVSEFDWEKIKDCRKCNLHCYVEPSLALSWDFEAYMHWAFHVNI